MNRNIANRVWTDVDRSFRVRGWVGTPYWVARNEFGVPAPRRQLRGHDQQPTVTLVRKIVEQRTEHAIGAVQLDGAWITDSINEHRVAVVSYTSGHPVRVGFNMSWFAGLHHIATVDHHAQLRLDAARACVSWWRDDRVLAMLAGYFTPVQRLAAAA